MNKVALVASNGEVNHIISTHVDPMYADGGTYSGLLAKHLTIDADNDEYISRKYWDFDSNAWADREPKPAVAMIWQDNTWVLDVEALFSEMRQYRDLYLSLSDWTQFPDSPLSDAKKAEWTTYRQALRDIPETYSDATSIDDITWPTQPEN